MLFALLFLLCACRPPGIGAPVDSGDSASRDSEPPEPEDTQGPDTIPDAPDPSDALFGEELPAFTIRISTANADLLDEEVAGGEHRYVEATFVYQDRSYGPVGLRLKGENSFESFRQKPSLKVDFDRFTEGLDLLGLKGVTLNNMDNDYSMLHERVAYRVYRELGIPAYRANHARLQVQELDPDGAVVSDRFYGLYTLLEDADRDFLERWFEDADGSLFEAWDVDFLDAYVPCPNLYGTAGCFQLEVGEDDRTRIQAVADAMELQGQAAIEAAEPVLDWDHFLRFWAAEALIAQFDAYPYTSPGDDCHVYDDPERGKLVHIPHGNDETFYYPDSDFTQVNGLLARRCKASETCWAAFEARVWESLDQTEAWGWLAWYDEVLAQVEPWIAADENRPYPDGYVHYYQEVMRGFIAGRAAGLQRWLGPRS